MFGPMLILYLVSVGNLAKDEFVSSISFLYVSAVVPWTFILMYFGVLDGERLLLSTLAAVPVSVGLYIGRQLRSHVSEQKFQKLVLVVLLASGSTMLWRAIGPV